MRLRLIFTTLLSLTLLAGCGGNGESGGGACVSSADCKNTKETCIDKVCRVRTVNPDCQDADGDGYGMSCDLGADCDDNDKTQTGIEVCDGIDNDCDGVADNGVGSPDCNDCDPNCRGGRVGGDGGWPLEGDDVTVDSVDVNDGGELILGSTRTNADFIWVANTGEGSVSRLNTTTFAEEARFFTGPDGGGNDPSRTSVNGSGDVYVANRDGNSISRISIRGSNCPDANGNGTVETSNGSVMLPWGADECVLWHTDLTDVFGADEKHVRAVAAQDVLDGLDGGVNEYVWVGGWDSQMIAKIDGRTGAVILKTSVAPLHPYGFALDGNNNLWIGQNTNAIGRVDTAKCVDDACGGAMEMSTADGNPAAVREVIPTPAAAYGITVDFKQRVWIGGSGAMRFDPSQPPGSRWAQGAVDTQLRGIAADAKGFIWGAAETSGIIQLDGDDPSQSKIFPNSASGSLYWGMAVDADGKIWGIAQDAGPLVITPGMTLGAGTSEADVALKTLNHYTYSDMTGQQLRFATSARGNYRHIFDGCDPGATNWGKLEFDATTPAQTRVIFRVKVAADRAGLEAAEWVTIGQMPSDSSPLDIAAKLAEAGLSGSVLMLEIGLFSDSSSNTMIVTPRVKSVGIEATCPGILQ